MSSTSKKDGGFSRKQKFECDIYRIDQWIRAQEMAVIPIPENGSRDMAALLLVSSCGFTPIADGFTANGFPDGDAFMVVNIYGNTDFLEIISKLVVWAGYYNFIHKAAGEEDAFYVTVDKGKHSISRPTRSRSWIFLP